MQIFVLPQRIIFCNSEILSNGSVIDQYLGCPLTGPSFFTRGGNMIRGSLANRLMVVGVALALGMGATFVASAPAGAAEPTELRTDTMSPPFANAVPGVAPADSDATAVYLDRDGRVIPMPVDSHTSSALSSASIGCTPVSGKDHPHRSKTGVAASGHGWWNKGNCSNDRANVQNCLYEWYTDNTWRQKACSPTKELRPAHGGSSDRTVARQDCHNTVVASWRNHVDVDVIGEIDTAERPMSQANVDCQVN